MPSVNSLQLLWCDNFSAAFMWGTYLQDLCDASAVYITLGIFCVTVSVRFYCELSGSCFYNALHCLICWLLCRFIYDYSAALLYLSAAFKLLCSTFYGTYRQLLLDNFSAASITLSWQLNNLSAALWTSLSDCIILCSRCDFSELCCITSLPAYVTSSALYGLSAALCVTHCSFLGILCSFRWLCRWWPFFCTLCITSLLHVILSAFIIIVCSFMWLSAALYTSLPAYVISLPLCIFVAALCGLSAALCGLPLQSMGSSALYVILAALCDSSAVWCCLLTSSSAAYVTLCSLCASVTYGLSAALLTCGLMWLLCSFVNLLFSLMWPSRQLS